MQDIRYCKLHFILVMNEGTTLPKNKASALRGGMGEMLLRMHCIRDRKCEICEFEPECLVRRTMYSKMDIQPEFMSRGDSVGYVLECENYQEELAEGEELKFNLLLFGKTIVYFSQFLQAIHQLGVHGLGKHKSTFRVAQITNTRGKPILDGNDVYMSRVGVERLSDYISHRKKRIMQTSPADGVEQGIPSEMEIRFRTPLSLKYQGEMLKEFSMNAIMQAAARRVYIMNCFEGIKSDQIETDAHVPRLLDSEVKQTQVKRYSSTHDEKINLNGIRGTVRIADVDETALELLLAGELLHIGKNTSFGFGKYVLSRENQ